jgi:hypothetical protein
MREFCVFLLVCLTAGCGGTVGEPFTSTGGGGPGGTPTLTAQLRIWVTDAPFPFASVESASVVIREVQVRDRDADRWVVVFSGQAEIDLVPLTGGVGMLLVEASPPAGTYDEVRLIVEAGEVVLGPDAIVEEDYVFSTANGRLHFPSGAQTGIKLKIENLIVVSTQVSADLVLDFDLARNFVFNGPVTNPPGVKRVIFTPTVRAINASTAGSITVTVRSDNVTPGDTLDDFAIQDATVRILDGNANVVATASTGADGRALVSVPPGTYGVSIEASGHASEVLTDILVVLANLSDLGDLLLAAAGEIGGVVLSDGGTPADDSDDVVVEGATVELRAAGGAGPALATTTTDASGMWRFDDLDAGDYDVTVMATGFGSGALADVGAALMTPGYTILIEALPRDLTGTVSVPEGVDVTSMMIQARNSAGVSVAMALPAADGTYTMTLATGVYEVVFDDGVMTRTIEVTVVGASPAPEPQVLDLSFE